jgi:single-strand DNA-binding protein
MPSYNLSIVAGHLGHDPSVRQIEGGKAVCNFSLATNDGSKEKPETNWHNIVVWDKQAESCAKYLKKGGAALVEGRLRNRKYKGKDGAEKTVTEIVASRVQFLGGKPADTEAPSEDVF